METLLATASRFWEASDPGARPSASTSHFAGSGDAGDGGPNSTGSLLPAFVRSGPLAFLRVEVVRFARSSKLLVTARTALPSPVPEDAPGGTSHQSPHATTFTRGAETVVLFPDGQLEFSVEAGPIDRDAARASLASLPTLAPFAVLAGADAEVMAWGTTRRFDGATTPFAAGLVKLLLATDRDGEAEERALREAGFAPSEEDEALWVTAAGDRTVIWAGATVYGYVGHVPACIGAWEDDPHEDDPES